MSKNNEAFEIVKKATSTPFLIKLWKILGDPNNKHAISWNSDGLGFEITDPEALEHDVLADHFRSTQFSSFQRQLNYFTFKKTGKRWVLMTPDAHNKFTHPCQGVLPPALSETKTRKCLADQTQNQHWWCQKMSSFLA